MASAKLHNYGQETIWVQRNIYFILMMCKINTVVQTKFSLMEDLKQRKIVTTVGKHRWGAGQSSSDAFVRDLKESD